MRRAIWSLGVVLFGAGLGVWCSSCSEDEGGYKTEEWVEKLRQDRRKPPYTKCERCGKRAGDKHECGLTVDFCESCFRDVGKGHLCDLTTGLCRHCRREIVDGHECEVTHLCLQCGREVGPNHQRGAVGESKCLTIYCKLCGNDHAAVHRHGETHFCPRCQREVGEAHDCDYTAFCERCGSEFSLLAHCVECQAPLQHMEEALAGVKVRCLQCGRREAGFVHRCHKTRYCHECEAERSFVHEHR